MNGRFIRRLNTRTCELYQNVISTEARIQGEHSSSIICSALSRRGCGWWAGRLEWVTQPKVCRVYLSRRTDDAYQIIARCARPALLTWRSRSSHGLNCHPSISALRSLHCVYIEQYHRVKDENLCDNIYCFVSLGVSALNVVVIIFFKSPQGVGNVNCIR